MRGKSGSGSLLELVVVVAVALGIALVVQAFVVKPYRIPSGSMEPTLAVGERVIVNRIGNRFAAPGVGDIVVFHPPHGADSGVNACRPRSRRLSRAWRPRMKRPTSTRTRP